MNKGLGVGLVQGFGGLTLAISVLASLTALGALRDLRPVKRWAAALLVGLPYLAASYLAQGAFKETMQALFVLAFAIGLWEISRSAERAAETRRSHALAAIAARQPWPFSPREASHLQLPRASWLVGAARHLGGR